MGLLRGRRGISILAGAMLVTGTLNTIATKLQVRAEKAQEEGDGGVDDDDGFVADLTETPFNIFLPAARST